MKDFSAAAMIRLIRLGLARQGIAPPAPAPTEGARAALAPKRALMEALLQTHGPIALLRLGEGVEDAPDEPALTALSLAVDPLDLIERWRRLERFSHSRHRTELLSAEGGRVTLRHRALAPFPPPKASEDLLIVGVLVGLLDRIGVCGLAAECVSGPAPRLGDGRWRGSPAALGDVSVWSIAWRAVREKATAAPDFCDARDWTDAARRALRADPARKWTLKDLAAAFGASPRSLQRRLQAEGLRFSELLNAARVAAASDMLCRTAHSAAEIGYACGFADQAHFTRRFKTETAATPAAFRTLFAEGAARPGLSHGAAPIGEADLGEAGRAGSRAGDVEAARS